jgi:selenocysteine-specific elongation factor
MVLVGTAGHVDHGKSTLVEALTGINPMHLPEEHRRELTIELGFAHLEHPDGYTISLVDVPGHEKLIRTMISGATAFELALWVVDARESLMPQSLEHLDILRLLGVPRIIPVITKADLATEQEIEDTQQAVSNLVQTRPVVVDSLSKRGIEELRNLLFASCAALRSARTAATEDLPYLPIDRCFVLQGVGSVVTGTLVRGHLREGDSVSVSSGTDVFRIRSLHNHHTAVRETGAGQRVGVQLHGVQANRVGRGDCLVSPGYPYRSRILNATLDLLPQTRFRWKPGVRALFLAAAFETECRLWGLLEDSGKTWVQIHLPDEACFFRGQRFILRSTNPLTTIGGGTVEDIAPDRMRRITEAERNRSRYFELSPPNVYATQELGRKWMVPPESLQGPDLRTARDRIWHKKLEAVAREIILGWVSQAGTREAEWSFQAVASALKLKAGNVSALLEVVLPSLKPDLKGDLTSTSSTLRYDPHRGALSDHEQKAAADLARKLAAAGRTPSRVAEYAAAASADRKTFDKALGRLLKEGVLLRIDQELVVDRAAWETFVAEIRGQLLEPVTVSEFGKRFGLSRKYSVPYLECLNRMNVMRRVGEKHQVKR